MSDFVELRYHQPDARTSGGEYFSQLAATLAYEGVRRYREEQVARNLAALADVPMIVVSPDASSATLPRPF